MGIYNLSQNVSFHCCLSFSQNAYGFYFSKATENSIIFETTSLLSNLVDIGQRVWKLLDKTFRESYTNKCKNIIAIKNRLKVFSKKSILSFYVQFHAQGNIWQLDPYNKETLRNKSDCCLRLNSLRGENNNTRFPSGWNRFGKHWPLQIFTK